MVIHQQLTITNLSEEVIIMAKAKKKCVTNIANNVTSALPLMLGSLVDRGLDVGLLFPTRFQLGSPISKLKQRSRTLVEPKAISQIKLNNQDKYLEYALDKSILLYCFEPDEQDPIKQCIIFSPKDLFQL